MTILPAQAHHIPAILNLLEEILQVHYDLRPDIFQAQGTKFSPEDLEKLLGNPQKPIFVYLDQENQVQGHLFLELKVADHPVKHPLKSLHIEDLCVAKEKRCLGIDRKLYDFAKSYAKEQECYNITLNVWDDNTKAKEFYFNLGLRPQQLQLEERL